MPKTKITDYKWANYHYTISHIRGSKEWILHLPYYVIQNPTHRFAVFDSNRKAQAKAVDVCSSALIRGVEVHKSAHQKYDDYLQLQCLIIKDKIIEELKAEIAILIKDQAELAYDDIMNPPEPSKNSFFAWLKSWKK